MSRATGVAGREDRRLERRVRIALWLILALSWVVAVVYMWEAVTATQTAERLELPTAVGVPSVRTWVAAAIFSGMELGLVLAVLWPWRGDFFASRLAVAGLALVTWFIMTAPMDVGRVDRVHRQWLAFMAAAALLGLMTLLACRLWQRIARRDRESLKAAAGD